ncbi:hypothetical protein, partial [Pseudomonas sp. NBRC 111124]|uniref:hypothetical protein n=1 Tax=Pseudomonas sp. NBRC 111124 TaxID=1661039 RepID=UPI001C44CF06
TSGISRTPTHIDPQMRKTYSTVGAIAQMPTGSLNSTQVIPLPAQSLPHLSRPATSSNVTVTATTALMSHSAPFQNIQTKSSTLAPVIQKEQVFNRTGYRYGGRDTSDFAAKALVVTVLGFVGIGVGFYFALKAIRKD